METARTNRKGGSFRMPGLFTDGRKSTASTQFTLLPPLPPTRGGFEFFLHRLIHRSAPLRSDIGHCPQQLDSWSSNAIPESYGPSMAPQRPSRCRQPAFTMPGALEVGGVRDEGTKRQNNSTGCPQKPIMRPGRYCTVSPQGPLGPLDPVLPQYFGSTAGQRAGLGGRGRSSSGWGRMLPQNRLMTL